MTEIREREKKFLEREKLAGVGEIAGGIAHEIRNPLFAISSGIQVLENELGLNKSQKEILDIIFSESMRVDHLVRQLLSYGHRDFQGFSPADLSLEEVTEEVERLNLGFLRAREISLRRVIAPGLPRLKVDRDQFIQVLLNLVHNAFDVSKTGQEITLEGSLNRGKNKIKIEVRDQGPGVPEELRDRIFDLFFTTKKGSSGMGLAVSRRIVLDHGGDIRVEQGKDGGAVFIVELPVAKTIGKTE
jgi:signal transduction histidine kinase